MSKQHSSIGSETYSFALRQIDLIEKSLKTYIKKEKKIEYDYDISLQIIPNPNDNHSLHMMSVDIFPKSQDKEIIATFKLGFVFEIPNLKNIAIISEEGITLPEGLLNLLNAVVIGTMRGVVFSELRGTLLSDVILPVLDPSKFKRGG